MAKKKAAAPAAGVAGNSIQQSIQAALANLGNYNPAAGMVPTGQGGYTAPAAAQPPAPPPPQPAPAPAPPPPAAPPPAAPVPQQGASMGQPIFAQQQPVPNNNVAQPGSGLGSAGGIFNNVATPYDSGQGLTGVQEQGINTMNQGQGLVQQGAGTLQSAVPQIGTAANTMGTGVNTLGTAQGQQGQAVGEANAANPAVGGLANVGANQLNTILSGTNLSPSSNPYLAQTAQAANQQLINQYQEATAPGLQAEAQFAYGGPGATQGSAFQQAQNYNEQALGQALGETDASIYGTNYANAQNQITQGLGLVGQTQQSQYAPANELSALAGNTANIGNALVGAGSSQLGVPEATLGLGSNLIGAGQAGVNTGATEFGAGTTQFGQQNASIDQLLGIGAQQQQQAQTGLTTAQQNAAAANQYPMNMLSGFGSLLGQATGGTGSQFSVGNTSK